MVNHYSIRLRERAKGHYLITKEILSQLPALPENGLLNLFIQHTSAGITINENADPTVRQDFDSFMDHIVPENMPFVKHDIEGPDDMPAHIKSTMVGNSLCIPIKSGRLLLGTWQGIYLCEYRTYPHSRNLIASIYS